jgi:hypothetical protein
VSRTGHSHDARSANGMTPTTGGAVEDVIEPVWLWPKTTMRPRRREEMPGSRITACPAHIAGLGDRPAVSLMN